MVGKYVSRFCFYIYFLGENGTRFANKVGICGHTETNQYMDGSSTKTVRWQKLKPEYHTRLLRACTLAVALPAALPRRHGNTYIGCSLQACSTAPATQEGLGDHMPWPYACRLQAHAEEQYTQEVFDS
jgi:hypothetical protein